MWGTLLNSFIGSKIKPIHLEVEVVTLWFDNTSSNLQINCLLFINPSSNKWRTPRWIQSIPKGPKDLCITLTEFMVSLCVCTLFCAAHCLWRRSQSRCSSNRVCLWSSFPSFTHSNSRFCLSSNHVCRSSSFSFLMRSNYRFHISSNGSCLFCSFSFLKCFWILLLQTL